MLARSLLIACLLVGAACGRFEPNSPVSLAAHPPEDGYRAALHTLRSLGYPIAQADEVHGFIRARAREGSRYQPVPDDSDAARRANWILVQVYRNGLLRIWVDGPLVRDGGRIVHRSLRRELESVALFIKAALARRPVGNSTC